VEIVFNVLINSITGQKIKTMFRNMKVSMRLSLGFGLFIALMIAVAWIAMARLGKLNESINLLVNDRYHKTTLANDMIDNVNITARAMRNALLLSDRDAINQELVRIDQARAVVTEDIANLEKITGTEQGKATLASLKDVRARYIAAQEHLMQLVAIGENKEAVAYMLKDMRSLQTAYLDSISKLIAYQHALMEKSGKEAQADYTSARQLVCLFTLVAFILGCVGTFLFTRSLLRQLGGEPARLAEIAGNVARGNLNDRFELKTDDSSSVMFSLKRTAGAVRALEADTSRLSAAAVEGKLAMRADASKHQGDFRKIIQGVNSTLDAERELMWLH
jgi:methyl-accepting chemotaxis protein